MLVVIDISGSFEICVFFLLCLFKRTLLIYTDGAEDCRGSYAASLVRVHGYKIRIILLILSVCHSLHSQ